MGRHRAWEVRAVAPRSPPCGVGRRRGLRPEGAGACAPRSRRHKPREGTAAAPAPAGFDTILRPFLSQNCFTCHGNKKHENDLNLQSFDTHASLVEHRDQWDEVVGKLRRGEMPPLEEEQPPEEQRQAVASWLARELERIDAATPPDPGRVTARRLNRTEYNNTIKELLGVDIRPADDFPQDDAGYGFDNIADVLSLSPVLMEKYVSAADRVARVALFGPPPMEPTLARLRSEGRKVIETVTDPAVVRRDRPEPAERVPRDAPHPGRRRIHRQSRARRTAAEVDRSRWPSRCGWTKSWCRSPPTIRRGPRHSSTIGRILAARPCR